jgi:hypothetical protein
VSVEHAESSPSEPAAPTEKRRAGGSRRSSPVESVTVHDPNGVGGEPSAVMAKPTVSKRDLLGRKQRFEARRVRRVLRHIDPWSVLKLSLVFFLCVWIMFMVAVVIIWSIAQSSGTIEKIEGFVTDLGVAGWKLNGTFIFRQFGLFGLVMVFACTSASVIGTIVFNLISDLVGGVWISVIEEDTARPVSS